MDKQKNKRLMTAAYQYAMTRLMLNLITFYDICCGDTQSSDQLEDITGGFLKLLKGILNRTATEAQIVQLRKQSMAVMEKLTAYVDCFQIYEYVLNRMELRFEEPVLFKLSEVDRVVAEVIEYISAAGSDNLMGTRVQSVLGQLPVRLTKQKFFEILSDSLKIFTASQKQNLQDCLYFIRTESMLDLPPDLQTGYERLYEILTLFLKQNYSGIEKAQYLLLKDHLGECTEYLNGESDRCLLLQELINDSYVIFLCTNEAFFDLKEKEWMIAVINAVILRFEHGQMHGIDEPLERELIKLEGKQEAAFEKYFRAGDLCETDWEDFLDAWKIQQLLSDSPFVKLERPAQDSEPAESEWVEREIKKLLSDLTVLFEHHSKPVVRAIMAKVLSTIPVPFQTIDDLQAFISGSLSVCTDSPEREISIQLIRSIMVDDNEMV